MYQNNPSQRSNSKKCYQGFTLIEILMALFIFTIVSMIIVNALHTIIAAQNSTQKNAERIAELQFALTLISRDFEQTINRTIVYPSGNIEQAFIGGKAWVIFTHAGLLNPLGELPRATLQRIRYRFENGNLFRDAWPQLDRGNNKPPNSRILLSNITDLRFSYLDEHNTTINRWPPADQVTPMPLPRAIRVTISFPDLGKITQLYVIPGQDLVKKK